MGEGGRKLVNIGIIPAPSGRAKLPCTFRSQKKRAANFVAKPLLNALYGSVMHPFPGVVGLASWPDIQHIINLTRIRGYNSVNMRHGYSLLQIRSPLEVLDHDR